MTDPEQAKLNLNGHTLSLCKGEKRITSDKRGISPMVDLLCGNVSLSGWSAADLVVGKAAALLFVYAKVKEVYGKVLSEEAEKVLKKHNIPYTYETLAPHIINRSGNDICPMEKLVGDVEDPAVALEILKKALYR